MSNIIVIYDQEREIAALVNADTQQGWGPAMIGPDAYDALSAFLVALPFDPGDLLTAEQATLAFKRFVEQAAGPQPEEAAAPPESALESVGDPQVDDGAALAVREATEASDAPAEQPADTDQDAGAAPAVRVVACFNCNGEGVIHFGDDTPDQPCNMCQGTGRIAQAV